MLAQTLGPSFLRGVEKDNGDRPRSHGSDVGGLICCFGMTAASREGNCPPQYRLKNRPLWPSPDTAIDSLYTVGAENKTALNNICAELLQRSEKEEDALLTRTIPVMKPGVFTTTHRRNDKSMEWHQQSSQAQTSTGEVVASVFWRLHNDPPTK
jgi:hypothetical protein